jgi:cytochrome c oxidase cbb3-type subunit I/II
MATFEGPLLSIRVVNALSHYSDWGIGHVHSGAMGWNGFMAAGMFYWLAPRLWNTKLHSKSLANFHFWIGLTGILLYVAAMWMSGLRQGLMLNATRNGGTELVYPQFVETLDSIMPLMMIRTFGGMLYLTGHLLMVYNLFRTIRSGKAVNETREVVVTRTEGQDRMTWRDVFINDPTVIMFGGLLLMLLWFFLPNYADLGALLSGVLLCYLAIQRFRQSGKAWSTWYERLLENYMPFSVLTLIAVAVGGIVQIIPTLTVNRAKNVEDRIQVPYTPLELAGRDIYVSEGCYNCHSQMIRTLVPDVLRYGPASRLGESIYDHPYQWGSKRTGPDLARVGKKYPDIWHFNHMLDPRSVNQNSNMPSYPWLFEAKTDIKALPEKIKVMTQLGVPYPTWTKDEIEQGALADARRIRDELAKAGAFPIPEDAKISALIAYLQKVGESKLVEHGDSKEPLTNTPAPMQPALPDTHRTPAVTSK